MRKFLLFLFCIGMLTNNLKAQNKPGQDAAIGAAAVGVMGLLAIWSYEEYKEVLESSATEYYIQMGNEGMFNVQLLMGDGTSMKDLSKTSMLVFAITKRQLNKQTKAEEVIKREVMTVFTTNGAWANEFGIVWGLVEVKIWSREEWADLYLAYLNQASPLNLNDPYNLPVYEKVNQRTYESFEGEKEIVNRNGVVKYYTLTDKKYGIDKVHSVSKYGLEMPVQDGYVEIFIPFYLFDTDTYSIVDYSKDFKLAYNENTLGLFLKSTGEYVEIKRNVLEKVSRFFW